LLSTAAGAASIELLERDMQLRAQLDSPPVSKDVIFRWQDPLPYVEQLRCYCNMAERAKAE